MAKPCRWKGCYRSPAKGLDLCPEHMTEVMERPSKANFGAYLVKMAEVLGYGVIGNALYEGLKAAMHMPIVGGGFSGPVELSTEELEARAMLDKVEAAASSLCMYADMGILGSFELERALTAAADAGDDLLDLELAISHAQRAILMPIPGVR